MVSTITYYRTKHSSLFLPPPLPADISCFNPKLEWDKGGFYQRSYMKEVPYQQTFFRSISFKISWSNLVLEKNGFWLESSALCCNILSFVKETLEKKFYTLRSI